MCVIVGVLDLDTSICGLRLDLLDKVIEQDTLQPVVEDTPNLDVVEFDNRPQGAMNPPFEVGALSIPLRLISIQCEN